MEVVVQHLSHDCGDDSEFDFGTSKSMQKEIIDNEYDTIDLLKSCSSSLIDNYQWPSPETDLSLEFAVPQTEDSLDLSLDVIHQSSYPSPNYESMLDEAVTTSLDAYLSPRGEDAMDFKKHSRSLSDESDQLEMGSVSFDDLLDGNYGVPAISDDLDEELKVFIGGNSLPTPTDEEGERVDIENISSDEEMSMKSSDGKRGFEMCQKENVESKDSDSKLLVTNANTESHVVILKKKDGSSKVLNIIPFKQSPKLATTIPSAELSVPRRSARTIRCSRSEPPTKQKRTISPMQSMYPDTSESPETMEDKSRKNAVQAKMNREKKKVYINSLEGKVSSLSKENDRLLSQTKKLVGEKNSLAEEVVYLRSVITNQSTLSRLLGNITDVKSVSLSTSFVNDRKRASDQDHDYGRPVKSKKSVQTSGGVCLHVKNDNVSLEFCSSCARMAEGASRSDVS